MIAAVKTPDSNFKPKDTSRFCRRKTILYTTRGRKKAGNAEVHSLKIRGAEQNSDSSDNLSYSEGNVNSEAFLPHEMTNAEPTTVGTFTNGSQSLGGSAPAINSAFDISIKEDKNVVKSEESHRVMSELKGHNARNVLHKRWFYGNRQIRT